MMQIRKATSRDLECIRELTRETIGQIYPKYYPQGAVEFFLSHHCDGAILADIRNGAVYLGVDEKDGIVGTVTVKNSEISRLFVLPEQQRKGYGEALLAYAEKLVFAEYPAVTLDASLPAKAMYLKKGYQTAEFHCLPAEKMAFLCYDVMVKQR